MNETVIIESLNIKDNNKTLVSELSLSIKNKEVFGLVGESGSGKTLTAKSIIGLLPKDLKLSAKKLITANESLLNTSQVKIKAHIGKNVGYIPQNTVFFLHPMIKIKNQIIDGYSYHFNKSKKEAIDKAVELLYKVGFENPNNILNMYPWQLSGGMRQRVNIAMALLCDPCLIVADEPTTALDSTVQKQVMELFKSINEELGISMLLISHDLGLIKHYSHNIAIMYAGQIVEQGETKKVFDNPRHPYTKLLIKIIPSLSKKKNELLAEIPGFVQEIGREKKGCLFFDRCPYKMDICKENVDEHNIEGHYYRCNLK